MSSRGGRSPSRRRKSNAPKSNIGKMLQDYHQIARFVNFNGLTAGGDIDLTLIDNDVDFTNAILKWSKLTLRPVYEPVDLAGSIFDARTLYMMIYKRDQDDSSVPTLDSEETIREMRLRKEILRGPWMVTTPEFVTQGFLPAMGGHMKPIVLRDFVLDREEDLRVCFTNASAAFAANGQVLTFYSRGYVRVIR